MLLIHHFFTSIVAVGFFFLVEAKSKAICNRPCINGGICKNRELYESSKADPLHPHHRFMTEQNQRQYCQCPTGFTGALCEIKFVLCDNGNQTCSNGNACQRAIDDFGSEYFHCECDQEESDFSLPNAAIFCEHASTVFCINDKDAVQIKQSRESLGGSARSSFCVNGGRCMDKVEQGHHFSGCSCPQDYSGHHCEISSVSHNIKKSLPHVSPAASTQSKRHMFLTFLTFLFCFVSLTIFVISLLIMYGNRNRIPRRIKSAEERSKIPKQSTMSNIEVV